MSSIEVTTYGLGGYDQAKPQGNVVSSITVVRPVEEVNLEAIESKIVAALAANAKYLALAAPSSAQNTAQTKALTRQMNALVRMTQGLLDSISDI